MTEQQLLKLTGDELSRALGEVLQPKGGSHLPENIVDSEWQCVLCGIQWDEASIISMDSMSQAKCIPFIHLTPDNAFKWREWAVEKFGDSHYVWQLRQIYKHECGGSGYEYSDYLFIFWLAKAQPEHYLKAAALCEIRSKK